MLAGNKACASGILSVIDLYREYIAGGMVYGYQPVYLTYFFTEHLLCFAVYNG